MNNNTSQYTIYHESHSSNIVLTWSLGAFSAFIFLTFSACSLTLSSRLMAALLETILVYLPSHQAIRDSAVWSKDSHFSSLVRTMKKLGSVASGVHSAHVFMQNHECCALWFLGFLFSYPQRLLNEHMGTNLGRRHTNILTGWCNITITSHVSSIHHIIDCNDWQTNHRLTLFWDLTHHPPRSSCHQGVVSE